MSLPITFTPSHSNFGSKPEHLALLEGKKLLTLLIPADLLEDHADNFGRFKSGPTNLPAEAVFKVLHFLVTGIIAQQEDLNQSIDNKGVPHLVPVLEQLTDAPSNAISKYYIQKKRYDQNPGAGDPPAMPAALLKQKERRGVKLQPPKVLAYRFFLFYDSLKKHASPARYLESYMRVNVENKLAEESSRFRKSSTIDFSNLIVKQSDWSNAIRILFSPCLELDGAIGGGSQLESAPLEGTTADPERILSLKKSFAYNKHLTIFNMEVDPEQLDIANYYNPFAAEHNRDVGIEDAYFSAGSQAEGDRVVSSISHNYSFKFPHPNRCWRYNLDQIRSFWILQIPQTFEAVQLNVLNSIDDPAYINLSEEMKKRGFVHINPQTGQYQLDRARYEEFLKSLDPDEAIQSRRQNPLQDHYKLLVGSAVPVQPEKYSPEYYQKMSVSERKRILKNYKLKMQQKDMQDWTDEQKQEELAMMMEEYFDKMASQFSALMDIQFKHMSPYLKHVVTFFDEYKSNHKGSASKRFLKTSSNLSIWEDFLVAMMREKELIFDVSTVHFKLLVNWFSAMNMSDPIRSNKILIANFGGARTSKTFVTEKVEKMCVPGTVQTLSYQTSKADTAAGNYDGVWVVFNEALDAMMGFDPDKAHGPDKRAQMMANPELENSWKELSTSGMKRVKTTHIEKETGDRIDKFLESYRNASYTFNTNSNPFKWSKPVLSRMILVPFQESIREGNRPIDKNHRVLSQDMVRREEEALEKYRWVHTHIRLIDEAIEKKKICSVNTEYSRTLLRQILQKAEEMGVPETDCPRKMASIMCAVRVAVKVRATLLTYGENINPLNPDGTKPYEYIDTIMMEPQLVDTDPSILVSVLGIFKFIYEDPVCFYVLRAIVLKYVDGVGVEGVEGEHASLPPGYHSDDEEDDAEMEYTLNNANLRHRKQKLLEAIQALKKRRHEREEKERQKKRKGERSTHVDLQRKAAEAFRSLHPSLVSIRHGHSIYDDEDHPMSPQQDQEEWKREQAEERRLQKELKEIQELEREQRQMSSSYGKEDWTDNPSSFWTAKRRQQLNHPALRHPRDSEFVRLRLPFLRPSKSGSPNSIPWMIYRMAQDLFPVLPEKPPVSHIEECLTQLCRMVFPRKRTNRVTGKKGTEYLRAFQIEEPYLVIRKELLLNNTKTRFEEAVREVVSKHIKKPQQFTFGQDTSDPNHHDRFKVITIHPKSFDVTQPHLLENQEFISKQMKRFNRINLEDMFDELELMELDEDSDDDEGSGEGFSSCREQIARARQRDDQIRASLDRSEQLESNDHFHSDDEGSDRDRIGRVSAEVVDPQAPVSSPEEEKARWLRKEKLRKRHEEDITFVPFFQMNYALADGVFWRHLKDIGWSHSMRRKYNAYPEHFLKEQLIRQYENRRELFKQLYANAKGESPLPQLEPYPNNMGFEDPNELKEKAEMDIKESMLKGKDGKVDPKYGYFEKIVPSARSLGLNEDEMIRIESVRFSEEDNEFCKNIAKAQFECEKRRIEQRQKDQEQSIRMIEMSRNNMGVSNLFEADEEGAEGEEEKNKDVYPSKQNAGAAPPPPPLDLNMDSESEREEFGKSDTESVNRSSVNETSSNGNSSSPNSPYLVGRSSSSSPPMSLPMAAESGPSSSYFHARSKYRAEYVMGEPKKKNVVVDEEEEGDE